MIEYLTHGVNAVDVALTLNRVALGTFFAISGYHKLFNKARHATIVKTFQDDRVPFVAVNQWFVPGVEFLGGLALILGLLTVIAAFGLVAICSVATCVDGLKRIKDWAPLDKADFVDDVLYLPEVLYALGLTVVILCGPGAHSCDHLIRAIFF